MSLLGAESWDIYGLHLNVTDYWTSTGAGTLVNGAGRCGTWAYRNGIGPGPQIGVPATTPGGYAAYALNPTQIEENLIEVEDALGNVQLQLVLQADGSLRVQTGPNTVLGTILGATPPGLVHQSHYAHIGMQWVLDNAAGSVQVYVDSVLWFSVAGVKTTANAPFGVPSTNWKSLDFHWLGDADDFYWGDAAGVGPWNAFMGDLRVEGQVALTDAVGGGGFYREFTPSTGTDHGALLDEIPPNDDVDYVSGDVVNLRETVKFPNITLASGTVLGIQLMPNVIKTLSGDRQIAALVRSGGSDALGTNQGVSQTMYTYRAQMFQVNPVGGAGWTAATANAMEGGIQIVI